MIWDLKNRQGFMTVQVPYPADQVSFSPDGQLLAVSYGFYHKKIGEIIVWNFDDIIRKVKIGEK